MASGERDLVLGTAGHIDHGKTALVRALTGVDTDRLPAEKQRGITIDLGFAALSLGAHRLALIDVPGHERFVRNMLAGASGLDLAMLVIAADDSVMPQTREHLEILRLLGLAGGLIVLTKCDLADLAWISLVEDEVRELVRGTFLENAAIVRTSAVTGLGIDELKVELARLCDSVTVRQDSGLFRMAIDRSFTVAGHGTVVTGTVASGSVCPGDDLEWQPAGRAVRVRGLHRHDQPVERLGRGSRGAINLVGVHHGEIGRGQELAAPGYLQATRILSVDVASSGEAVRALRHRGRYRVHLGTAEVAATLALLEGNDLAPGAHQLGQLFLAAAGGRRLRAAVRDPRGEPSRDTGGRTRAATSGAPPPQARSGGHGAIEPAAIGRPARASVRGPGVPGSQALDRARSVCPDRAADRSGLADARSTDRNRRPRRCASRSAPVVANSGRVRC